MTGTTNKKKTNPTEWSLEIDKLNLDEELSKQAAIYVFVAQEAYKSQEEYEKLEAKVAQFEAELDLYYRQEFERNGQKITDKAIDAAIKRDERYLKAKHQLIEAKRRFNDAMAKQKAWFMRKDLLVQLAFNARSELSSLLNEHISEDDYVQKNKGKK